MRRLGAACVAVALLAVASLALGATSVVRAEATISGSGTTFRWTVRNTGDEPLRCVGLLLDGVQPTAATGPAGVLTRVGTFQGRGLVHMQAQTNDVVAPGATVTVEFTTNVPIPTNAGGEIRYSSTCAVGSDVIGRATGPTPPPPPPPPPCECQELDAKITKVNKRLSDVATHVRVNVTWTLECSQGSGRCKSGLKVLVPRKFRRASKEDNLSGTCAGPCNKRTRGTRYLSFRSGNPGVRTDSIVMRVQFECAGERSERLYTMVFRGKDNDVLDLKRSDLNGNKVPDGKD